jgi:creatinine amidohydrolase/Fe(II)-dependent formamide hydrolase-like protein
MMRAMLRMQTLIIVLAALLPSIAWTAPTLRLEEMTTTELREAIGAGKTTILVPIGGTEQNGAHMALGKHNRRALLLSERIAEALGNALVAPVVAYVPEGSVDAAAGHLRLAGTITTPPEAFIATLESAARSFRLHGFRDIVFLGDHGGYQGDIANATQRLNRRWAGDAARAHALPEYYRVVENDYAQLLRARGLADREIGLHAGLADTALMLALDPAYVRKDRLGAPGAGVNGDPQRATPELGQLGVDLIVSRATSAIRKAASRR